MLHTGQRKKKGKRYMKKEFIIGLIGFAILAFLVILYDWNDVEGMERSLSIRREMCDTTPEPTQVASPVPTPTEAPKQKKKKTKRQQYNYISCSLEKGVQRKIMKICKKRNLDYTLVMALIEQESDYDTTCISDAGESIGLMQIQPVWYREKIKDLNITDLKNPVQNVSLGTLILSELINKYDNVNCALMAYNMGEPRARLLWKKGIYESNYSMRVREIQKRIEKEV